VLVSTSHQPLILVLSTTSLYTEYKAVTGGDAVSVRGGEFGGRRAPYAPISALAKFFDRIRDRQIPDRVDHNYLSKLNVAHNNEYALLSALKFLGVVDEHGTPTMVYKNLQTTQAFRHTLWHLVTVAYKPLFNVGAEAWGLEEQINFFRVSSSASQAKNAARFFRAVCDLAGHRPWDDIDPASPDVHLREMHVELSSDAPSPPPPYDLHRGPASLSPNGSGADHHASPAQIDAKAELLAKLPPPRLDWSAEQYLQICDRFLQMLQHLDGLE
jgi:hypothetical protein